MNDSPFVLSGSPMRQVDLTYLGSAAPACVKCGSTAGEDGPLWQGVKCSDGGLYSEPYYVNERLEYRCRTCGFPRTEATLDAIPPPEREPVRYFLIERLPAPRRWWQFWR